MATSSPLNANVARYDFEASQLAPETFEVLRFSGAEGLSALFEFELELIAEDPDLDFANVVNQPATFTMMRGDEPVPVSGIVTDFLQDGRTADYVGYRATLRPRLWRLSLSFQSRIFQEMTVDEIVRNVLEDSGFTSSDYRFELQESYATSEYCVQYQETDLNFVSRLMEEEGIYYFFEHAQGRDVIVMTDHRGVHEMIADPATLRFHEGAGMVGQDAETIQRFTCREQIVTGKVQLRDYNYETPEVLMADSQINGDMPGVRYEYGSGFGDTQEGDRLARVRNQEIEAQRRVMRGRSDSLGLRSGFQFALEEHFRDALNEEYLITHVEHEGSQREGLHVDVGEPEGRRDGSSNPGYRNVFTCIPAEVQYRPPRETPKPDVPGVITARVESAGGDYAYIDDQGRYRAQMHFDTRDRSDGTATLPIRMKQAYSGSGYGIHFPNHADTEMILAHVNGDVNRPIALGTVPNPSQQSPSVAENKMQNVIRTWGKNELTLDDTKGEENIYLHGTKDWTIEIANDKNQTVGNNESLNVGKNRDKTVGASQTENVGENKSINVGKNHSESIEGNASINVGGNEEVSIGENQNTSVGSNMSVSVGDNKSLNVGKNHSESIGKDASTNIGDNLTIEVGKDGKMVVGKKTTIQSGDDLTITGRKKAVISVSDQLTLKCGKASIILKKNGDVQIKGGKINIKGSGDVKIKGSKVAAN